MTVWSGLSAGRRTVVILAIIAMFATVLALSRGATQPSMALLYGALEERAAGDVITALEQQGVPYEVRGTSIYVPATQRDQLRMALAGQGLPATSAQGYELLDSLTGFGTTSQMFDAAYWRAKEGELARTILTSPFVRSARVHISTPTNRPFQREDRPTASVTVTTAAGTLSPAQANALRYLVASSVSGLSPEDVAVIDGEGGLIGGTDEDAQAGGQALSEELQARAERLLEARVGFGNAVVEVSVETVTEQESIVERLIDPESRVAISTEVEERSNASNDTRGGDVTVAGNLPAGDAAGGNNGNSSSEDSETRSLTNYEVSQTSREVLRNPGAVKRMTVAVLVNDATVTDADGNVVSEPRSEEELQTLQELVASAVGFDEARGDEITVRSMAFEPLEELGTEAVEAGGLPLDIMSLIQIGVLALVALILGLFVVRPILSPGKAMAALPPPDEGSDPDWFGQNGFPGPGGLEMKVIDSDALPDGDPVTRLRRMIEERQDETIQILQSWVEEPDGKERA
jgi:flagellar M-ring protein FliF